MWAGIFRTVYCYLSQAHSSNYLFLVNTFSRTVGILGLPWNLHLCRYLGTGQWLLFQWAKTLAWEIRNSKNILLSLKSWQALLFYWNKLTAKTSFQQGFSLSLWNYNIYPHLELWNARVCVVSIDKVRNRPSALLFFYSPWPLLRNPGQKKKGYKDMPWYYWLVWLLKLRLAS